MPFPSGRCKTCRARHLKCDEQRPNCSPCLKSNRECHWDDVDHSSLVFRNENHFASNMAKRQRGGARRPTPATNPTSTGRPSVHVINLDLPSTEKPVPNTVRKRQPPKLPRTLPTAESVLDHALARFSRSYLQQDGNLSSDIWGFFFRYRHDFFPNGSQTCFNAAFNAFALKFYGQTMHYEPAHERAREWYSLALVQLRDSIRNEATAHDDEVLMSCLFLSSYEDYGREFDAMTIATQGCPHLMGAASLVHLRQANKSDSKRSRELDRVVARRAVRQAVYRGASVPEDVVDLMVESASAVDVALDTYIGRVADLRHHMLQTIATFSALDPILQEASTQPLLDLLYRSLELDSNLRVWYKNIPQNWRFQERLLSDEEYARCAPSGILYHRYVYEHSHSAFDGAVSLNRYRAARMITLSVLTRVITDPVMQYYIDTIQAPILPHYTSPESTTSLPSETLLRYVRKTTYTLTDDVCATIPHFFTTPSSPRYPSTVPEVLDTAFASRVGQLVWPLIIVSATRMCPDPQREYVKKMMGLIGKVTGGITLERIAKLDLHLSTRPIVLKESLPREYSDSMSLSLSEAPAFTTMSDLTYINT